MKRDHDAIRAEIERLKHAGKFLACEVVDAARDESSPLHVCFTWDDGEAAHQYRLIEARNLLRVYVERPEGTEGPVVRAFVSLTTDRVEKGGGYRSIADVMSDDELYQQWLKDAIVQLRNFQKKYQDIKELGSVWSAVDEVEKKAEGTAARRHQTARPSHALAVNG